MAVAESNDDAFTLSMDYWLHELAYVWTASNDPVRAYDSLVESMYNCRDN